MDNTKSEIFPPDWFYQKIISIPEGTSKATLENRLYIVTKTTSNCGQIIKFFAEEAGGRDYVSLNVYKAGDRIYIRPVNNQFRRVRFFFKMLTF